MSPKATRLAIAGYIFFAVIAWGESYSHFNREWKVDVAECEARGGNYCDLFDTTPQAAMLSTILWPLYLSYRIFNALEAK